MPQKPVKEPEDGLMSSSHLLIQINLRLFQPSIHVIVEAGAEPTHLPPVTAALPVTVVRLTASAVAAPMEAEVWRASNCRVGPRCPMAATIGSDHRSSTQYVLARHTLNGFHRLNERSVS